MPQVCLLRRFRFRLQRQGAGRSRSSLAGIASENCVYKHRMARRGARADSAGTQRGCSEDTARPARRDGWVHHSAMDVHSSTRHSCQSRWISVIAQKSTRCKPRTAGLKRNASPVSSTIVRRSADVELGVRWTWRLTRGGFARSSKSFSDLTRGTGHALHQLSARRHTC